MSELFDLAIKTACVLLTWLTNIRIVRLISLSDFIVRCSQFGMSYCYGVVLLFMIFS